MAKELYIYSPLYDFTAETVVKQLNEVPENEELTIRMNTPGGEVTAGWSIISKMSERKTPINAIIDGDAASMGALMLVFFNKVIANDTSTIMFHKAAFPEWYKPNEAEMQKLKTINSQFKEKLEAKVSGKPGAQKFLDKVFEPDIRNDVELTPEAAKELGIVNEVRKLEPTAFDIRMQIVAISNKENKIEGSKETPDLSGEVNNNLKIKSMDLAKLKAEHPAVYAQAFAEGRTEGQKEERDRVEAWAVYTEVDAAKVKAGIENGEKLSMKAMAEFNLQSAQSQKIDAMKEENADDTNTENVVQTEAQVQAEKDKAILDEAFGTTKKES